MSLSFEVLMICSVIAGLQRVEKVRTAHPEVAIDLNNLASVLQAQGDLAGVRNRLERALAIYQQGPPSYPRASVSSCWGASRRTSIAPRRDYGCWPRATPSIRCS